MRNQNLLIYRNRQSNLTDSWAQLAKRYSLLFARNLEKATSCLTQEYVACIITQLSSASSAVTDELLYFRTCFQTIPIIVLGGRKSSAIPSPGEGERAMRFLPEFREPALLQEVAALIGDYSFLPDPKVFGIKPEMFPPRVKRALGLIQNSLFSKTLTVTNIALHLNVHRCHFEREFRQNCRISPKQLIIGLKLLFACHLMKNTGMKLWHVSQLAGFDDYYGFCKLFRKHLGTTPREFRPVTGNQDFVQHFGNLFLPNEKKFATKLQ